MQRVLGLMMSEAVTMLEIIKKLRLTKGVHVVIDQSKFPLGQAVYFDTEKMDV